MAPAASSKTAKRNGKENAPPARNLKSSKVIDVEEDFDEEDSFGAISANETHAKSSKPASKPVSKLAVSSRALRPSKAQQSESEGEEERQGSRGIKGTKESAVEVGDVDAGPGKAGKGDDLQRKLATMTVERERLRSQRDAFAKQFEELSKLRNTDTEAVFEKYKEKVTLQAKIQSDLIESLTALNEKLQSRIQSLEKAAKALPAAGGPFEAPMKADLKEVNAFKEELAKVRGELAKKEERISSLEREYRAEVEHSRRLQANANRSSAAPTSSAAVFTTPEEAEKDAKAIRLYEDLTELNISNVKIKPGKYGKEVVFNCVQTVDKRSVNFKLRSFNEPDPALVAKRADNPWVTMLHYSPEHLDMERDEDLLNRLGLFKTEFTVPRAQVGALWEQLKLRISREGDYEAVAGEE